MFNLLARAYKNHESLDETGADQLFEYLKAATLLLGHVFLLVDALDELVTHSSFLTRLLDAQQHSTLKFLFTARPINAIPERLACSRTINILAAQTDVQEYVSHHVTELSGAVCGNIVLQGEVTEVITKNVKGM